MSWLRGLGAILLLMLAGCYGPGTMGWGMNGTTFEVAKRDGFVEVTEVGRGPMKAVPSGSPVEYVDDPPTWDDFGVQFQASRMRIAFGEAATKESQELPAGEPWPLNRTASGTIRLGDRLYFCNPEPQQAPFRFAAVMVGSGADYNLWFEAVPRCD